MNNTPPIISRDVIARHLGIATLLDPAADAFKAVSAGRSRLGIDILHPTDYSDIHVKSAVLEGASVFTVKLAGWSARNEAAGLPASSGMIMVFDSASCRPIAMLQDDHLISDLRTAAAGALAAQVLSNHTLTTVGLLGAGEQALRQIEALRLVREFEEVRIWNRGKDRAKKLKAVLAAMYPELRIMVEDTAQTVVETADLVVCATASKEPVIKPEWLKPGVHITSVGSDDGTKAELDPECLKMADLVVVDSGAAAGEFGNARRAIAEQAVAPEDLTEFGHILSGRAPGRQSENQITIATFVGLGIQDLTAVQLLTERMKL